MHKYAGHRDVRYDPEHCRYYFPTLKPREPRRFEYRSPAGRRTARNLAWQPQIRATGEGRDYWIHLAARLAFLRLAAHQWVLAVRPERHLTRDGETPLPSRRIGRRVTRMKAKMYNDKYLGEVHLWLSFLSSQQPRVLVDFGGQSAVIETSLLRFQIRWPGVLNDKPQAMSAPFDDDLFTLTDLEEALAGRARRPYTEDDEEDFDESEGN
jgi:hypothetical protein